MGMKSAVSIQFLFYALCVVFTAYWPMRLVLLGVDAASSLALGLLLVTPWVVILFMEGRKMKFQYLPATAYSIFLSALTLAGVEEGFFLRSEGLSLMDAVIKNFYKMRLSEMLHRALGHYLSPMHQQSLIGYGISEAMYLNIGLGSKTIICYRN